MMKVAHIIKSLDTGGVETWLKDLSYITEDKLDFILHNNSASYYEDEVKENSAKITRIPLRLGMLTFSKKLYNHFKKESFDVVHSHVNLASGWMLFIAWLAGVPIRVAHCHNDKRSEYKTHSFSKKLYYFFAKVLVNLFSNKKIAVSKDCAPSMFYSSSKVNILPCGLNLIAKDNKLSRSELGLQNDDIVLAHVGRFVPQKNHLFLLDLMTLLKSESNFKLLLIGDGKGYTEVEEIIGKRNLTNIKLLGVRSDVKELMKYTADFFLLPSKFEGLGLVAVESQSNNLFTLVADTVPKDVKISDFLEFLPIDKASTWKERLLELTASKEHIKAKRLPFDNRKFSIEENYRQLTVIYSGSKAL
ncbi:glycosyltransferase [uncultured Pseudoalteromonas sp.]|uniref:glycosyltransferase n=1 Tax=uncultured Pseudoalteromonas sp. TaxID=114053 RepID=UPI0025934621|nr:glycosyltransferase [uncultured Pseudoalteromonas sp.]